MVRSFRAKYAGALARYRYAGKKAFSKKVALSRRKFPRRKAMSRGVSGFHVHNYKRWGATDVWEETGDGTTTFWSTAKTFSLSGVTNHSELTQLYDQYKIMAVVVKVHMLNNPDTIYPPGGSVTANPPNHTAYPKLWYFRDYDDNTAPADRTTLKQIGKAKCFTLRPNKTYSFKVKPAVLNLLSGTATQPIWPARLDCTDSVQTHYGMKFCLDYEMTPPLTGVPIKLAFETLYYLKMFNSR